MEEMKLLEIDVVGHINRNFLGNKNGWALILISSLTGYGLNASLQKNKHERPTCERRNHRTNKLFKVRRSCINHFKK